MLGSAFSLAGIPGSHEEDGSGTFLLAIDPGILAGREEYLQRATDLVRHVAAAAPLPGHRVVLPGQQGDELARAAEVAGEVDIAEPIWRELEASSPARRRAGRFSVGSPVIHVRFERCLRKIRRCSDLRAATLAPPAWVCEGLGGVEPLGTRVCEQGRT